MVGPLLKGEHPLLLHQGRRRVIQAHHRLLPLGEGHQLDPRVGGRGSNKDCRNQGRDCQSFRFHGYLLVCLSPSKIRAVYLTTSLAFPARSKVYWMESMSTFS